MKERIIEFLRSENKSSAQLAEEIGVQPSGISHILSGRNKPSLDFVIKMLEKYRFISTEWLLFGKGKMYRDQEMQDLFEESAGTEVKSGAAAIPEKLNVAEYEKQGLPEKKELKRISEVEKIVWFYNDKTFTEYFPVSETDKKTGS